MATTVVNRRREREEAYIGRGSPFGNPYRIGVDGTRAEVIAKYRAWFRRQLGGPRGREFAEQVERLRGKRLGCYCKPLPCHGDVIVEWLEGAKK